MKRSNIIPIIILIISCSSSDKSRTDKANSILIADKDSSYIQDTSKKELSGKKITITVSYAAIACGCPQWFETKYTNVDFLEGVERFYLEPVNKSLTNAMVYGMESICRFF